MKSNSKLKAARSKRRPAQHGVHLTDEAHRLLLELTGEGGTSAQARPVTMATAGARRQACADLLAAGLAEWTGSEPEQSLRPSPAGLARVRRDLAGGKDPFLSQHRATTAIEIEMNGVARVVEIDEAESPLAWLRKRRDKSGRPMIDDDAFVAGERFRADLTVAMMLPRVTVDWNSIGGAGGGGRQSGPAAATDAALAARQRVNTASKAIGGDFAGLLIDVCGFLKGLETVERERDWPARSAKVVLNLALRRLAEHYGLSSVAKGPDRSTGIRHWAAVGDCPQAAGPGA